MNILASQNLSVNEKVCEGTQFRNGCANLDEIQCECRVPTS